MGAKISVWTRTLGVCLNLCTDLDFRGCKKAFIFNKVRTYKRVPCSFLNFGRKQLFFLKFLEEEFFIIDYRTFMV